MSKSKFATILLVILTTAVTACFFVDPLNPDSNEYLKFAQDFLGQVSLMSSDINTYRTPGFPLIIWLLQGSITANITIQILSLFALAHFTADQFQLNQEQKRKWLLLTLVIYFLSAALVNTTLSFLTDFWFTFFLFIGFIFITKKRYFLFFLGSVFLGYATLIRPVAFFLTPLILALLIGFDFKNKIAFKDILKKSFVFLIFSFLIPQLWCWRNYKAIGVWDFSTISAYHMTYYRGAGIIASVEKRNFFEVQNEISQTFPRRIKTADQYHQMFEFGKTQIKEHFGTYLAQTLKGTSVLVFDPGISELGKRFGLFGSYALRDGALVKFKSMGLVATAKEYFDKRSPFEVFLFGFFFLSNLLLIIIFFVSLYKIWRSRRLTDPSVIMSLMIIFYLMAVSSGVESTGRLKAPIIPFIIWLYIFSNFNLTDQLRVSKDRE
jgi:hypothetical protein